jgi:serine protease AprX
LTRLDADPNYAEKGVTIAFLDSGFYPHPDLIEPASRILEYKDLIDVNASLDSNAPTESWQWHGTQTSVVAAGNGRLSDGIYRGLACDAQLVLVKVSDKGRITEERIIAGPSLLQWKAPAD